MNQFAFVFPGQGSQRLGMMDEWSDNRIVQATLEEANEALGMDMQALIANGPSEALDSTVNTQPAMLTADIALWRAWLDAGGALPAVIAGHSLGEYAALVAADVLGFSEALRFVQRRGLLMQQAVPDGQGAMAAVIGMADDAVVALCEELAQTDILDAVNFNATGQVVIAGHVAAVERVVAQGKAAGARMVVPIPVSVPAHSRLMNHVADQLSAALASIDLRPPRIPLLHNLHAETCQDSGDLSQAVAQQVCKPVQWVKTLNNMASRYNITAGFECGPGQVLCSLAKRTIRSVPFKSLATPEGMEIALQESAKA
ncbi:MAG: ACP S-malonyltransferase [Oceanococcus sp.]